MSQIYQTDITGDINPMAYLDFGNEGRMKMNMCTEQYE